MIWRLMFQDPTLRRLRVWLLILPALAMGFSIMQMGVNVVHRIYFGSWDSGDTTQVILNALFWGLLVLALFGLQAHHRALPHQLTLPLDPRTIALIRIGTIMAIIVLAALLVGIFIYGDYEYTTQRITDLRIEAENTPTRPNLPDLIARTEERLLSLQISIRRSVHTFFGSLLILLFLRIPAPHLRVYPADWRHRLQLAEVIVAISIWTTLAPMYSTWLILPVILVSLFSGIMVLRRTPASFELIAMRNDDTQVRTDREVLRDGKLRSMVTVWRSLNSKASRAALLVLFLIGMLLGNRYFGLAGTMISVLLFAMIIRSSARRRYQLAGLPISPARAFSITVLPAILVLLIGASITTLTGNPSKKPLIGLNFGSFTKDTIQVPGDFMSIQHTDNKDRESFQGKDSATMLGHDHPYFIFGGLVGWSVHNPFTPHSDSYDPPLLMTGMSNAIETLHGFKIAPEELRDRYFWKDDKYSFVHNEERIDIFADYPQLQRPDRGGVFAMSFLMIALLWSGISALALAKLRSPSFSKRRWRIWARLRWIIPCLLLILIAISSFFVEPWWRFWLIVPMIIFGWPMLIIMSTIDWFHLSDSWLATAGYLSRGLPGGAVVAWILAILTACLMIWYVKCVYCRSELRR